MIMVCEQLWKFSDAEGWWFGGLGGVEFLGGSWFALRAVLAAVLAGRAGVDAWCCTAVTPHTEIRVILLRCIAIDDSRS